MTTEPIRKKEDIEAIKNYFLQNNRVRDYTLFVLGINTGIRIGSLIELKWNDVYDKESGTIFSQVIAVPTNSGRKVSITLNEHCKTALAMLINEKNGNFAPSDYIFESKNGGHITRFRAFQIIKRASEVVGLEGNISCQSMRKTLGYYSWKEGAQSALLMDMYKYYSVNEVKKHLGIEQEHETAFAYPNL